jgi:lantibiotic biosynthesis protein
LDFLSKTSGPVRDNIYCLWAIKGDDLLKDFDLELEMKIEVMQQLQKAYYEEFKVDKSVKHQIDAKFRKYKVTIEQALTDPLQHNFAEIPFKLFKIRLEKLKPIARKLLETY